MPPTIDPPWSRDEIAASLERLHRESTAFWESFTTDDFFRPLGTAWSPAENVRHLNKATRPVGQALKAPKLILWWRFGRTRRPSKEYLALTASYREALAAGGNAGRFAPGPDREEDLAAWRRKIMDQRQAILGDMLSGLRRWSEKSLDRYQLPHPLLGKLTVREMLFFTIHHQRHHVGVVEQRMGA